MGLRAVQSLHQLHLCLKLLLWPAAGSLNSDRHSVLQHLPGCQMLARACLLRNWLSLQHQSHQHQHQTTVQGCYCRLHARPGGLFWMPSQSLSGHLSLTRFQTVVVAEAQVLDLTLHDYQCLSQSLGL